LSRKLSGVETNCGIPALLVRHINIGAIEFHQDCYGRNDLQNEKLLTAFLQSKSPSRLGALQSQTAAHMLTTAIQYV
jgi:hypothetical protein